MNDNTAQPTPNVSSSNVNDQFSNAMNRTTVQTNATKTNVDKDQKTLSALDELKRLLEEKDDGVKVKPVPSSYVDDYQPPKSLGVQAVGQSMPSASNDANSTVSNDSTFAKEDKDEELEEILKTLKELLAKKDELVKQSKVVAEEETKTNLDNQETKDDEEVLKLEDSDEPLLDNKSVIDEPTVVESAQEHSSDEVAVNNNVVEQEDVDESLEAMNIFDMLGVDADGDELKESFLDDLQDAVWDDFLEHDIADLLTTTQMVEFEQLKDKRDGIAKENKEAYLNAQDRLISYIEPLVPNLEELMLKKALELKKSLFLERVATMKEESVDDQAKMTELDKVEKLVSEDKYYSASKLLNSL